MKAHGLNLDCKLEINGKPLKLKRSKIKGYINLGSNKNKVTIPMRSFVANFLRIIYAHFNKDAGYSKIKTVIVSSASAASDTWGIQIGADDLGVDPTRTSLHIKIPHTVTGINYLAGEISSVPQVSGQNSLFKFRRYFENASSGSIEIHELGVIVKDSASKFMVIEDESDDDSLFLGPGEISTCEYTIQSTHNATYGGILLNMIKWIHNAIFAGNVNNSSMLRYNGTTFASTFGAASTAAACSYFAVNSGASDEYGIVVGYDDKITQPNSTSMTKLTTNLTKTATSLSAVAINGGETSFTLTRDFTNTGSSNISINRIGILTKANIYFAINNTVSNIILQPNQKLRVTYTFSTTC